jgi:sigma-B regulation protein RsbU (phosphoserine phosphatase)
MLLYDVMGHGLEATQVKAFCRKVAAQVGEAWLRGKSGVDLNQTASVIATLNRKLQTECQDCGRFLSVFYGVLDPGGKELTYTSAGHDPPILVKASGEYVPLTETDLLLGVELETDYHTVSVSLDPGDTLVLYSDGMIEAFNADDVMFDRRGLLTAVKNARGLSAEAILRRALTSLREFLDGREITDELSLLVVKVGEADRFQESS